MEKKVFIHTDSKQYLGALLSKYTIERYSKNLDKFSVEIIEVEKEKEITKLFGKEIIYDGKEQIYSADDIQAFTLSRFCPPQIMKYKGRAVVIDPDIFATYHDIYELLNMNMKGKAIFCRKHKRNEWGSSVMLLDCSKLKHWSSKNFVDMLLKKKVDYRDIMSLKLEDSKTIGELDKIWNSFDELTPKTKLLHNTLRITQPWRTGLKLDFTPKKMKPFFGIVPREWAHFLVGKNPYRHREHPDKDQISFFFGHLKSAVIEGKITRDQIVNEVNLGHIRKDALKVLEKTKAI